MEVITPKIKEKLSTKLIVRLWKVYDKGDTNVNKDDYQFIASIQENDKCKRKIAMK